MLSSRRRISVAEGHGSTERDLSIPIWIQGEGSANQTWRHGKHPNRNRDRYRDPVFVPPHFMLEHWILKYFLLVLHGKPFHHPVNPVKTFPFPHLSFCPAAIFRRTSHSFKVCHYGFKSHLTVAPLWLTRFCVSCGTCWNAIR